MDLLSSADQLELVAVASEFFSEQLPISAIRDRRDEPSAITRKLWSAGADLGLLGVSAGEDIGGAGLDLEDEALLFRELGRGLVPGPFLASVLGARLAGLAGHADLARSIVTGEVLVGLAERRDGEPRGGRPVRGTFDLFDTPDTRYVLVVDPSGAALLDTASLTDVRTIECIDPGTRLASAQAGGAAPLCWVAAGDDPIRSRGLVLASAVLVGIAEAARDQAVEYAKTRVQFGRPIGVNQAIKHACVDMAVAAEAAWEQTLFAAISLRSGRGDAEFQVLAANVVAGRAALDNAAASIQVHGGMGYTYEHDAHLYLKRAHVVEQFFGSTRDQLGGLLGQEAAQ
ncbi:MAG: putative Acyl-CoA dehydrogenase [Streptosporangiaceae bacterium]|nr:putative Acyl-CoA dehydrogenase [Streptosporangiaceae bacterium]